jgi:MFS family permease
MRQVITLVVIFYGTFVIMAFLTPPDPLSHWVVSTATLLLAIPSYFVGIRHGRKSPNTPGRVPDRRQMITLAVIVLAAFSLAAALGPAPFSPLYFLQGFGILAIATACYFVGQANGRRATRNAPSP